MKAIKVALVATCLLVGATAASANVRENVSLRISPVGVNFADAASVNAFRGRVAREIAQFCNPGDRIGADLSPDFQCRRELSARIEPTIAALVTSAGAKVATN
jgi:UrcA family protein